MPTGIYNENSTPFGSRVEAIFRPNATDGTYELLGLFEFESIDIDEPSTEIEKHDHIGKPKGWVSVNGFRKGTGTVQIPSAADANANAASETGAVEGVALTNGDAFVDDFGNGIELWIVVNGKRPFMQKEYRKQTVNMRQSLNPPPAPAAIFTADNTATALIANGATVP